MAIHNQPLQEGDSGFKKTFEAGSEALLFDFIQSAQYQYPIKSAIRELVTNAIDSTREKNRFFDIHAGKAKVEDFYIHRDDAMYKDSNYNPDYYDERWLSKQDNRVKLIYQVNNSAQRDNLRIIDTGVGLGGLRLEKHFNPLFSTKRNNTQDLGKFGIGSKAGLALEVDYYTLISRYNGGEFHFNVYSYKVDPIIPRLNTTTGKTNPYYEMQTQKDKGKPKKVYYLPTKLPNGVEIILQAKKGLRKDFIDAVKSQLLYLDDIDFEIHENGIIVEEEVKAKIEYEDDIFVLPDASSTYYSKPHIILNGICYGYINYLSMEQEEKIGNIGMKIPPERVDINPNRESIRYSERTISTLKEYTKQGEKAAEKLLNEALICDDLLEWAMKTSAAHGGMQNDSIISRFAQLVDVKHIKPKFTPMPKIRYESNPMELMKGYTVLLVTPEQRFSKARQAHIAGLKREEVWLWSRFSGKPIFYQTEDTSFRTDMYLLSHYPGGFIKIQPRNLVPRSEQRLTKDELTKIAKVTWEDWLKMPESEKEEISNKQRKFYKEQEELMDDLIQKSKFVEQYSEVKVPEDFKVREKEDKEEEDEIVEQVKEKMGDAERRKFENRVIVNAFEYNSVDYYRAKREPKIKEIIEDKDTIIYGFQEDEENLKLVFTLFKPNNWEISWPTDKKSDCEQKIVMISQANHKYFKHHMFVNDFFMNFNPETKTISMHTKLVQWQTARRLSLLLPKMAFLQRFGLFDPIAYDRYREIKDYVNKHSVSLNSMNSEMVSTLENYADKVTEFQIFLSKHPGDFQAIASMSKALFETSEEDAFQGAIGIDLDIYQIALDLEEHTSSIHTMLNELPILTGENKSIQYELEMEIREYLKFKGYISYQNAALPPTPQAGDQAEINEAETLNI